MNKRVGRIEISGGDLGGWVRISLHSNHATIETLELTSTDDLVDLQYAVARMLERRKDSNAQF